MTKHPLKKFIASIFILIAINTHVVNSHEVIENRASIVLRNKNHLQISIYLNIGQVLYLMSNQKEEWTSFISFYAALSDAQFNEEIKKTKLLIQNGIYIQSIIGTNLQITAWRWPDNKSLREHIRNLAMQALVAPELHGHAKPIEIFAQSIDTKNISNLSIGIIPALRPMTIVTTEPKLYRLESSQSLKVIQF